MALRQNLITLFSLRRDKILIEILSYFIAFDVAKLHFE